MWSAGSGAKAHDGHAAVASCHDGSTSSGHQASPPQLATAPAVPVQPVRGGDFARPNRPWDGPPAVPPFSPDVEPFHTSIRRSEPVATSIITHLP